MTGERTDGTGRRTAALRGAVAVAGATLALGVLLVAVRAAGVGTHGLLGMVAHEVCTIGGGPVVALAALAAAGAATGALLGLLARVIRRRVAVRRAILLLAAVPALWLVTAVALAVLMLLHALDPGTARLTFRDVLEFSLIATVATELVALPAALPAAASILVLEGWTRPAHLPQGGLARPAVRRWVGLGVVTWTAALLTFAALRWPGG